MSQRDDIEQLTQAIADLEAFIREELIALQYEILGARDALSEELAAHTEEIKRQMRLTRRN